MRISHISPDGILRSSAVSVRHRHPDHAVADADGTGSDGRTGAAGSRYRPRCVIWQRRVRAVTDGAESVTGAPTLALGGAKECTRSERSSRGTQRCLGLHAKWPWRGTRDRRLVPKVRRKRYRGCDPAEPTARPGRHRDGRRCIKFTDDAGTKPLLGVVIVRGCSVTMPLTNAASS